MDGVLSGRPPPPRPSSRALGTCRGRTQECRTSRWEPDDLLHVTVRDGSEVRRAPGRALPRQGWCPAPRRDPSGPESSGSPGGGRQDGPCCRVTSARLGNWPGPREPGFCGAERWVCFRLAQTGQPEPAPHDRGPQHGGPRHPGSLSASRRQTPAWVPGRTVPVPSPTAGTSATGSPPAVRGCGWGSRPRSPVAVGRELARGVG